MLFRSNAFTHRGALQSDGPLKGRVLGPGQIELRSAGMVRRISLGGHDNFFDVEQTGGAPDWTISTPSDLESSRARFSIEAPDARIETQRKPFSILYRLHFPEATPRRARFSLEPKR